MSEFNNHLEVEIGSEKNFGVVFAVFFAIIGLYPLIQGESLHIWSLVVAGIFLLLAFVAPQTLKYPNLAWHKFGLLLAMIIAPLAMLIVYIIAFLPIGFLLRLSGKDLLRRKLDANAESYWIEREEPVGSMKNQF